MRIALVHSIAWVLLAILPAAASGTTCPQRLIALESRLVSQAAELTAFKTLIGDAYRTGDKNNSTFRIAEALASLPVTAAATFASGFLRLSKDGQAAVWLRLENLVHGIKFDQAVRRAATVIAKIADPSRLSPRRTLADLSPALQASVAAHRANFLAHPQSLFRHVLSFSSWQRDNAFDPQLDHGGHSVSILQAWSGTRPADSPMARASRRLIEEKLDPEIKLLHAIFGRTPEVPEDEPFSPFLHRLGAVSVLRRPSDVRCLVLPREVFAPHAWENTRVASALGAMPIGGKTFFPGHWDATTLRDAVQQVLAAPDSTVISYDASRPDLRLTLANEYAGVVVAVALGQGRVATAYPTWYQVGSASIGDVYRRQWQAQKNLQLRVKAMEYFAGYAMPGPAQLIAEYFASPGRPPLPAKTTWLSDLLNPNNLERFREVVEGPLGRLPWTLTRRSPTDEDIRALAHSRMLGATYHDLAVSMQLAVSRLNSRTREVERMEKALGF